MPKIKVNDVSIFYETFGQGEPLIFISGFNSDHTLWQNMVDEYAKRYRVVVIDNRGMGQSDCPDYPYTIDIMAKDIIALCQTLQINQAHFIGSSMGGAIVQNIAANFSEYVCSIVIENSFMQIDQRFALFAKTILELMQAGIALSQLIKLALPWIYSRDFLSQDGFIDKSVKLSLEDPYPETELGYKHQLHALLNFNSSGWVHTIKVPCLVIGSDSDMIVPEDHMHQISQRIPNSNYYKFVNCGHLPHIEQTETFNQVVLDFLNKNIL